MKKIGAIFDWDGVVVDSCKEHLDSWRMLAEATDTQFPKISCSTLSASAMSKSYPTS